MGNHDFVSPGDLFFQSIFENHSEASVLLDAAGNVVLVNRAARDLPAIDVVGLFEPGAYDLASFYAQLRLGGRGSSELHVRKTDGGGRKLELEGRQEGDFRVVVVRDVTVRQEIDDELQHLRRIESFGYLMASVAHDFSNLLTVIGCSTDALEGVARNNLMVQSEQVLSLAGEIQQASDRASTIVRQLLSRVRRTSSKPEPVQLGHVVREIKPLIERLMGDSVHVSLTLDPDLGPALVDRSMLEHALLNMAVNARAAMPDGGRFTITTRNVTLGDEELCGEDTSVRGRYIALSAADTGVGMSREVRDRVFERFFTTKGGTQGSGLGLSMVRRFVVQSGGCVTAHSEPGQGTTIAMYLPRMTRTTAQADWRPCCQL